MSMHTLDSVEAYVLRLVCSGLKLQGPEDLLLFVRAAGQGQNLRLDVRAAGVWKLDAATADDWVVDVIMTSVDQGMPIFADDGPAMAKNVAADDRIQGAFPGLVIKSGVFGELTAPASAIDAWRVQPILWDHAVSGPKGRGGPTATFAQPVDLSTFKGKADDGRAAVPWRVTTVPIAPHNREEPTSSAGWWVLGGVAVVGIGALIWHRSRGK